MEKSIGQSASVKTRKAEILKKTGWSENEYRRQLNNFRKRVRNYEQASGSAKLNTSKLFYDSVRGRGANRETLRQIQATPTTSQGFKVSESLRARYFENYKAGFHGGLFNSREFKKTGYYSQLQEIFKDKSLTFDEAKRRADLVVKSMNEDRKLRRKLYEAKHGQSPTGSKQYIRYEAESLEEYADEVGLYD